MPASAIRSRRSRLLIFSLSLGLLLLTAIFTPISYSDGVPRRKAKRVDQCSVERSRLSKEEELRYRLRTLRQAIDKYKAACESGQVGPMDRKVNDECYPPNLDVLVKGIHPPNKSDSIIKFLRRIPIDPITGRAEWGLLSMFDPLDSTTWGKQHVYDVYSLSEEVGIDGMKYRDW